jgi:hypothetical protein
VLARVARRLGGLQRRAAFDEWRHQAQAARQEAAQAFEAAATVAAAAQEQRLVEQRWRQAQAKILRVWRAADLRLLAAALRGWAAALARRVELRRRAMLVVRRLAGLCLREAFLRFAGAGRAARHLARSQQLRALEDRQAAAAASTAELKATLQKAGEGMAGLHAVVSSIATDTAGAARVEALERRLGESEAALRARMDVQRRQQLENHMRRIVQRMSHRLLGEAWQALKAGAYEALRQRRLLHRTRRRMRRLALGEAFKLWSVDWRQMQHRAIEGALALIKEHSSSFHEVAEAKFDALLEQTEEQQSALEGRLDDTARQLYQAMDDRFRSSLDYAADQHELGALRAAAPPPILQPPPRPSADDGAHHLSPGFVNASPATRANAVATEELEAALAAHPAAAAALAAAAGRSALERAFWALKVHYLDSIDARVALMRRRLQPACAAPDGSHDPARSAHAAAAGLT